MKKNNENCNKNIKCIKLDNLSENEQVFIGYNSNNPREDVGSSKPVYSDDTDSSEED